MRVLVARDVREIGMRRPGERDQRHIRSGTSRSRNRRMPRCVQRGCEHRYDPSAFTRGKALRSLDDPLRRN